MQATIRRILAKVGRLEVPADTLDDHADLYEAGLSSHATVHVMLAIENAFDIEIPDCMLTRQLCRSIQSYRQPAAGRTFALRRIGMDHQSGRHHGAVEPADTAPADPARMQLFRMRPFCMRKTMRRRLLGRRHV